MKKENKKILIRRELIKRLKKKKPSFRRQNWRHYKRITRSWRAPRGIHNKLQRKIGGKGKMPLIGYGTPKIIRGLHPSGYEEVLVSNQTSLQNIDKETQAIRISATVGKKKRIEIINRAEELGIKVLNK